MVKGKAGQIMIKHAIGKPAVTHRVGHCVNCGWVHSEIRRVRVSEGKIAVIKALCVKCIKEQPVFVLCDLCGNKKCDNLYPVSIIRRAFGEGHSCNLFLHLCAECRQIQHQEVLQRLNVPNVCDTCKDRFMCFTEKYERTPRSKANSGILDDERTWIHKRINIERLRGKFNV